MFPAGTGQEWSSASHTMPPEKYGAHGAPYRTRNSSCCFFNPKSTAPLPCHPCGCGIGVQKGSKTHSTDPPAAGCAVRTKQNRPTLHFSSMFPAGTGQGWWSVSHAMAWKNMVRTAHPTARAILPVDFSCLEAPLLGRATHAVAESACKKAANPRSTAASAVGCSGLLLPPHMTTPSRCHDHTTPTPFAFCP